MANYSALPLWKRRALKKVRDTFPQWKRLFPQWKRHRIHSGSDTVSTLEVDSKLNRAQSWH